MCIEGRYGGGVNEEGRDEKPLRLSANLGRGGDAIVRERHGCRRLKKRGCGRSDKAARAVLGAKNSV